VSTAKNAPAVRERWRDLTYYLAAAFGPLAVMACMLRLWAADLSIPFSYGADALYYLGEIKGWFETGSHYVNSYLGAPGVSETYDFPSADMLNVALIRVFGFLGANAGLAMNLFYLIGWVFLGLSTAFVVRRLGISRLVGLAVTFLYLFVPYHHERGEGHLFLAMFWIVPLQLLVLFWLDSDDPPLINAERGGFPLQIRSRRSIAAVLIALAGGALGIYYMFFGCFFLVLVALRRGLQDRVWRPALAAGVLILIMAAVFLAQMTPTLVYQQRHGKDPDAAPRSSFEAELYGLRVTQMLLPIMDHRIPAFATKRLHYMELSPSGGTEANFAALGVVGSAGFILCLSAFLFAWPRDRGGDRTEDRAPPAGSAVGLRWLGFLTLGALLLATFGGFGAVFAGLVSPQIRAYNRISVYIALFALVLLGVLADRIVGRRASTRWRTGWLVVVVAVAALGILDQTPSSLWKDVQASADDYRTDAAFGRQVQAALPAGSTVFQLPYIPYPGYGDLYGLRDYDPLKGFVHTDGFRWSYGSMKGRPDAAWQEATSQLPPAELLARIREAGFTALWIQFNGYEDGGKAVKAQYEALLGPPTTVRNDGTIAVWKL
jgi:phosphoglycerol transferase